MEYFILFFLVVGILTLAGWLLLWLSGVMAGLLEPITILLGWLTAHLPGTPAQSALMSTTLLFLFFRVLLLPYWAMHARVHWATGKVLPELVSQSCGGRASGDWFADKGCPTALYPTNRAFRRLLLLLLLGGAFYFAVLRATEHGVATWPTSQGILRFTFGDFENHDKPLKKDDNRLVTFSVGCGFLGLGTCVLCFVALGLALAIAALLSVVLPVAKTSGGGGPGAFLRAHRDFGPVFLLSAAEWVVLCAAVLATRIFCRDHPLTDYLVGGYVLTVVLYSPIWSAASALMDWRNDRWVASLVRECKTAADPEIRRVAEAKLANLGPWVPK